MWTLGNYVKMDNKSLDEKSFTVRFNLYEPMSKGGYKCWSPKLRPKVYRKVVSKVITFKFKRKQLQDIFGNIDKIGKFCYDNLWEGEWIMFGYSKGKTKTGVKLVGLCKINLKVHGDTYHAVINHCKPIRLPRYWFWEKRRK